MAVTTIQDLLDTLARSDVSRAAIQNVAKVESAVAKLRKPVPMNAVQGGAVLMNDITVSAKAYEGTTTIQEGAFTESTMIAKPLTAIVVVGRWIETDVEYFTEQLQTKLGNEFARAIDAQILRNPDGVFGTSIVAAASGIGNYYTTTSGTNYALYDDLNQTAGLVEANGYEVNGVIGRVGDLTAVRGAKDANGNPIFVSKLAGSESDDLMGVPFYKVGPKVLPKTATVGETRFVLGQWDQLIWGIHDQLDFKLVTEGDISDGSNTYKLSASDQVAIVARMRIAFMVPTPGAFAFLRES